MSMNGMGSGTSRLPMTEPMRGVHIMPGPRDMLILQVNVWPVYTDQGGPRGGSKFYAQSMAMGMWIHNLFGVLGDGAKFTGQAMMSLEPAMRPDGYPPSCTAIPSSIIPKRRSPITGSVPRISSTAW